MKLQMSGPGTPTQDMTGKQAPLCHKLLWRREERRAHSFGTQPPGVPCGAGSVPQVLPQAPAASGAELGGGTECLLLPGSGGHLRACDNTSWGYRQRLLAQGVLSPGMDWLCHGSLLLSIFIVLRHGTDVRSSLFYRP